MCYTKHHHRDTELAVWPEERPLPRGEARGPERRGVQDPAGNPLYLLEGARADARILVDLLRRLVSDAMARGFSRSRMRRAARVWDRNIEAEKALREVVLAQW